jgi:ankyrin repeat protein
MVPLALYQFFFYYVRKPLNDALIEAVKKNDLAQVESLLVRGADINSGDSTRFRSCTEAFPPRTRRTPLILSMFKFSRDPQAEWDTAMMDLLLKHGANPNVGDAEGKTPLYFASSQGNIPAVKALLSNGADANVKDSTGDTPLIEAAYRGNIEVVKLLLAHGANVNTKGFLGFSALARTTGYRDNIEIMKLLLAHGADKNTRNKFGKTPLHGAADYGRTEAMRILLQHGADPNVKDYNGQTPLMMVAGYGTKALDKRQDNNQPDKIEQRKALMQNLLTNSVTKGEAKGT